MGAGLEVAVEGIAHHPESSDLATGYALAIPVAIFVVLLWVLHAPLVERVSIPPAATLVAVVLIGIAPFAGPMFGAAVVTVAITLVTVLLLIVALADARRSSSTLEV